MQFVRGLAVSPDGNRVAAATDAGLAVREADGRWTWAYRVPASTFAPTFGVAFASDGSLWTDQGGWPTRTLVHLTESGDAWTAEKVACPSGGGSVVVATDGSVWTGGIGYNGTPGLARYDGRSCMALTPPGVGPDFETGAIARDPNGGVVLGVHDPGGSGDGPQPTEHTLWTDGTTWRELRAEEGAAFTLSTMTVDAGGDPVVWSTTEWAVLRLHAGTWEPLGPVQFAWTIAIAPDGTMWTTSSEGIFRIRGLDVGR